MTLLFQERYCCQHKKNGVEKELNVASDEVDVANVLSVYVESWGLHILVCYHPPCYSPAENDSLILYYFRFVC